jgi:hypothetical protein
MDRDKCSVLNSIMTWPSFLCNFIVPAELPYAKSQVYAAPYFVIMWDLLHIMAWWIKHKSTYCAKFLFRDHLLVHGQMLSFHQTSPIFQGLPLWMVPSNLLPTDLSCFITYGVWLLSLLFKRLTHFPFFFYV